MRRALLFVITACALAGSSLRAQSTATTTTLSGVYTAEQAGRGQDLYAGSCRGCHTPASHTGATFATYWLHKSVADLFAYVLTSMPKNDPGSLDPHDVADVVAYLLKMNQMPAGTTELPADTAALRKILIDSKQSAEPSTKGKSP